MKKLLLLPLLILPFSLFASDSIQKKSWMGTLHFNAVQLRLVLHTVQTRDSLKATLDSPDQGATGIPVSTVSLTGDSLNFGIAVLQATYRGKLNATKDTCTGVFYQAGLKLPLALAIQKEEFVLNRPQEPKPPFNYRTEEVTFKNPEAGITLAGTLTLPAFQGKYPALILVSGSGPQNRNEELMGHKPFLLLADMLTNMGFAVLRYDDRGIGKSGGTFKTATTYDFAEDAASALQYLRGRDDIDTSRLGILGHSEGGIIAEILAAQPGTVNFAVLLAGPSLVGEEILRLQSKLISEASGLPEQDIEESAGLNKDIYTILKKTGDSARAAQKITKVLQDYNKKAKDKKDLDTISQAQLEMQVKTLTSPWFRTFLVLNPMDYIQKIHIPILALYGGRDLQVPAVENAREMEKGLLFAGNDRFTVITVPGVNHLFQDTDTGLPSEYGKIEQTMSPATLDNLRTWLMSNVQW